MRRVRFHPAAERELALDAHYYDASSPGLGQRFTAEVEAALRLAAEFPGIGAPHRHGTRRVFPKRFPFSIVYRLVGTDLVVLAVASFARRPGYWRDRVSRLP